MNRQQWIRLLVLFIASIGIAIAGANLLASQPSLDEHSAYQTSALTATKASPIEFPVNYRQQFLQYAAVDCPNSRMVRKMYINRESLGAIAASQTVPSGTMIVMETHSAHLGNDGRLVSIQLNNVFIRKKQTGWRVDPNSGEWQSAWYSPSGSLVSDDQSSCISCHTRVRDRDYVFTLPTLITAAQTRLLQKQQTEFGTSVCR
jgi:Cytochrome P460